MTKQLYLDWYGRRLPMHFDLTRLEHSQFNFIMLMARRIGERRRFSGEARRVVAEAKTYFYDFLEQSRIDFGHHEYDWSPAAAFDVADEYLNYD